MSGFPAALAAHLEGSLTNVCHCWRLVRRDGIVMGFTDHDLPLTVGSTLYEPQSGLTASEARSSLGLSADPRRRRGRAVFGRHSRGGYRGRPL